MSVDGGAATAVVASGATPAANGGVRDITVMIDEYDNGRKKVEATRFVDKTHFLGENHKVGQVQSPSATAQYSMWVMGPDDKESPQARLF